MGESRFHRPFGGQGHDGRQPGQPPGSDGFGPGGYPPGAGYPGRDGLDRRGSGLHRFLGGSPAAVLGKLIFLSLLVGAGMAMIGVTPTILFAQAFETVRSLVALGFDTFHDAGRWFVAGAVVVVPLWLLSRLFAANR